MKTNRLLPGAALAMCFAVVPLAPAADPAPAESKPFRTQWEHCAFAHDLRGDQTNAETARTIVNLGKEGWELVSVARFTEGGTTTKTTYYFKRRL